MYYCFSSRPARSAVCVVRLDLVWNWKQSISSGIRWAWEHEVLDDAKQSIKIAGKPLVADLAVSLLTKGFFFCHDAITGDHTEHWVTASIYYAEQGLIAVLFLTFSAGDLIETISRSVIRIKKSWVGFRREIQTETKTAHLTTIASPGTLLGHDVNAINQSIANRSEDVQQKIGEQDD
jgi:hypothetical protein